MNKIITLLLFTLLIGCDQIQELSQPTAEQVLTQYFDAQRNADFPAIHSLLAETDRDYRSIQQLQSSDSDRKLARVIRRRISYKIASVSAGETRVSALVEVTEPDAKAIVTEFMGMALQEVLQGGEADMENNLEKMFEPDNLPMKTNLEEFVLVKENDGWHVLEDFKRKDDEEAERVAEEAERVAKEERIAAEEKARKQKVRDLLGKARELESERGFVKAVAAYSNVLSVDPENETAKEGLSKIEAAIQKEKEQLAYIPKVKLFEFEATKIDTYTKKGVPAVRFAIKNEGNRSLNKVKVTIYFQDSAGNNIFEKEYTPVLVSEYNFRNNMPLKPNYVKRQEEGTYYTIEDLGKEWKVGAARAVITEIEFTE
jgi:hypothetical protein